MDNDVLPRRVVAAYAVGSVGTGGFGVLPGLVLSYYLTDTLGVGAGLAGLVVTLPKIWDVVIDPFVGRMSDAQARRRGSRRRMLLTGAATLPLAFVLLFAAPSSLTGAPAALWVLVAFVLATTAFSLFQVPYIAQPAQLAPTYEARTRLLAPRIAVLALAILAFGAGGPVIRDGLGGGRGGYLAMAVVTGAVIGLGMVLSAVGTTPRSTTPRSSARRSLAPSVAAGRPGSAAPEPVPTTTPAGDDLPGGVPALREGLAALRESSALRTLLATFVLQALATGAMLAAAQYVATYVLGSQAAVTGLFIALVAPALLVMAPARRLADHIGKQRALGVATVLFVVSCVSLLAMAVAPGPWVYGSVAIAGVAYAGMQLYPLAMLPDVIARDAARRGDRAGVIAGVWTAGETAGLALGPTVALGVLWLTGFVSRTGGAPAEQPASAVLGVVLIFSAVPAVLAAASLLPLSRYRLPAAVPTDPEVDS